MVFPFHLATWEHHYETAEITALQEAHRQEGKRSSGEEEEEEDEISSSGEEEDEEKDRDADEEGEEEEEEPLAEPKSGPSQPFSGRGKLADRNLFALLGEDEC